MQSPTSGPAVASSRKLGIFPTIGGRYLALGVLFSMNLLNYVDRYSFFAVGGMSRKGSGSTISRWGS